MRHIYIVIGQGMGFNGYESWNVKAFFSKEKAEKFQGLCIDADKKYRDKKERLRKYYGYVCHGAKYGWEKTEHDTIINEIDSKYDGCVGDIEYYVEPIELFYSKNCFMVAIVRISKFITIIKMKVFSN